MDEKLKKGLNNKSPLSFFFCMFDKLNKIFLKKIIMKILYFSQNILFFQCHRKKIYCYLAIS